MSTIAIIIKVGCSTASLRALLESPPIPLVKIAFNPLGEVKNNTNPIKNCKCIVMRVNNARRISFAPYSFLPIRPIREFMVVITNTHRTRYAQGECTN